MTYRVAKSSSPRVTSDWTAKEWQAIKSLELTYSMGVRPEHFPKTQAKLRYDENAIYVIFRVEDRYVKAVAKQSHGAVYNDSCAEFFFTPDKELSTTYFNLEMNCGGTMLFHFQTAPQSEPTKIASDELAKIKVSHSLPKLIDPEITEPTVWTISYRLPIEVIKNTYPNAVQPQSGVRWRANFYKCADRTSHPHWLTWNPVQHPSPNFHLPNFFGMLEFE